MSRLRQGSGGPGLAARARSLVARFWVKPLIYAAAFLPLSDRALGRLASWIARRGFYWAAARRERA